MDEITYSRSLDKRIEEQVKRWQTDQKKKYKKPIRPVITISRLPGSMASELAGKLAKDLDIDLFDQEIVEKIAESADKSKRVVESLDEQDRSILEEWITALGEDHMSAYEYLHALTNVVGAIGAHGHAIIVGRGASFILPKEVCLRVFVVAPLPVRIKNVMRKFNVSEKEASRQVMKLEAAAKAFIQKYFQVDLMDPTNFDLVINTHSIDIDLAARIIKETYDTRHWYDYSGKNK